jgi:hypothetical protein
MTAGFEARKARLAWRASDSLALDVRSLAVSRMALGALLLLDLRERAGVLRDFYTDDGFVPRSAARDLWSAMLPHALPPWSSYLSGGSAAFQTSCLVVYAACGVAIIAGYRTRIAAVLAYVSLLSFGQRDVLVTGGDDSMLATFLFAGAFVPLDRVWSVEARPASRSDAPVFSLGTFAFTAQLVLLLFFAGLQKVVSSPAWRDGSAIHLVLRDVSATAFGRWLGTLPLVDRALDYGVLAAEIGGAVALCLPVSPRVRMAAVAYVAVNLLGFAAALDVGRLPWIALAALVAHVPSAAWERIARRRATSAWEGAGRIEAVSPAARVVLVIALLYAVAYDVARLGNDVANPEWLEAPAGVLFPRQGWGMFRKAGAGVPEWYVVAGTRPGATTPTVRVPDGAVLMAGPESDVGRLQGNLRWGYFWSHADWLAADYPDVLQRYLGRACDEMRARVALDRVEIIRVRRSGSPPERETIAARDCRSRGKDRP